MADTVEELHRGTSISKFGSRGFYRKGDGYVQFTGPAHGLVRMADIPEAPLTGYRAAQELWDALGLGRSCQRSRWRALGFAPAFNHPLHRDCWILQWVAADPPWPPCVVACVGELTAREHAESGAALSPTAPPAASRDTFRVPRKPQPQRAADGPTDGKATPAVPVAPESTPDPGATASTGKPKGPRGREGDQLPDSCPQQAAVEPRGSSRATANRNRRVPVMCPVRGT